MNFLILRGVGVAAEMDVPFAGLDALLRPVLDLLDTIPPAQAQALRGALALESTEPNGLAAYAGALSLLSAAAADRGPVLVVVDDAQWLDRLSIQALTFAARRVAGEGIALLFAARSEPDAAFVATGLDELEVRALSSTDSLRAAPGAVGRDLRARCGPPDRRRDRREPIGAPRGGGAAQRPPAGRRGSARRCAARHRERRTQRSPADGLAFGAHAVCVAPRGGRRTWTLIPDVGVLEPAEHAGLGADPRRRGELLATRL